MMPTRTNHTNPPTVQGRQQDRDLQPELSPEASPVALVANSADESGGFLSLAAALAALTALVLSRLATA